MESDIVSGQQSAWVLLKKLGEGDAGEVFLVESLLEKQPAILKRPARSAFASDVIRQTSQITIEGKILKALSTAATIDGDFPVSVPELIDLSRPGTAFSDRLFIIIEKAPGFDLSLLIRTAHLGMLSGTDSLAETPEEKRFLQSLAERGQAPERVLLFALNALLGMFEKIHQRPLDVEGIEYGGILWNDVKPEHLFWDPWRARLTVIDWGNGQLLERDGATRDRRFSAADDYRQWLDEMGRFIEMAAPALYSRLEWPGRVNPGETDPQAITRLQERIIEALQEQMSGLTDARDREAVLLRRGTADSEPRRRNQKKPAADQPPATPLAALESLHREIIGYGEMPNYTETLGLALSWAARFAAAGQMAEVEETCAWAEGLPGSDTKHLRLAARLARITQRADTQGATRAQHECLSETVQSALRRDWPGVLWGLLSTLRDAPEPDWWYDLVSEVREQEIGHEDGDRQPLLVTRRGLLTLQAMAERMERAGSEVNPASLERLQDLVRHLREEVVPNWAHIDPAPPHANLTYAEIDEMLDEIQAFSPEIRQTLDRALTPARTQARQVLDHWGNGLFSQAIDGLRQVLLWDPDRKRVLRAEQAILQTPLWLEKVQRGPQAGEHYISFVSEIEFEGRDLRSQVGPAGWMDLILEGCRQLRRGAWPPDLFSSLPLLVKEMPWLRRFERVERLPDGTSDHVTPGELPSFTPLNGTARGKLGVEGDMQLGIPLDGWIGEARGSSARVFSGQLRDAAGKLIPAAIKLMRMDKVEYALPLFREEVIVLNVMREVPGITPLYECGFINLEEGSVLPSERDARPNPGLSGGMIRIGPGMGQEFVQQIEQRANDGWMPYLAIEMRDSQDNLLTLCDAGMTGGQYRPVAELLLMSIQICEIMEEAHRRNIVYRDHKILHYYWIEAARGIYTIDWNVAKLHPEGLSNYEKQMDMVQFGARALHHILTGRTAPGALPLGPTRPEEIEQAAKSYEAQWTYDDQRLPEDVRRILERVLAGDYNNAVQLRDDLKQSFLNLPAV
jgi:serine/threonine protein kinase